MCVRERERDSVCEGERWCVCVREKKTGCGLGCGVWCFGFTVEGCGLCVVPGVFPYEISELLELGCRV